MAVNSSNISFADWRRTTNENLMSTAEELLEKLEDVADMLVEIDEAYSKKDSTSTSSTDSHTANPGASGEDDSGHREMVQRFHEGVDNARSIIGVLKREKWRLSRREMSVEMRMGELEEYKSHLKNDMSSLNQTVEVLSLRVVQQENQLMEAQETQEQLEAQLAETKGAIEDYKRRLADALKENARLKKDFEAIQAQTPHTLMTENTMVKNEIAVLMDENKKLKELIRNAESITSPTTDEHLTRLTRDFLRQLSSLDDDEEPPKSAGSDHVTFPPEQDLGDPSSLAGCRQDGANKAVAIT